MKRDRLSFVDFKANFIDQPDGWFAVYTSFKEDYHGGNLRVLELDMICEWRLSDGKIKFLEVPFDTEEEFNALVIYLRVTTDLLNKAILENIGELSYTTTLPEREGIPYPPSTIPTLSDEKLEAIHKEAARYEWRLIWDALVTEFPDLPILDHYKNQAEQNDHRV